MRVLGVPVLLPQNVLNRVLSDVAAVALAARSAPDQIDRLLELGEEIVTIGHRVLEIAERLDWRAEGIMHLGERLDGRANELIELGAGMHALGQRIDERGGELADRASSVVATGDELINVMPTFERALDMATPLEGAIDRFGRLVDRLPGGGARRRTAGGEPIDPDSAQSASADAGPRAGVEPADPPA